jgi:hypothetical protein
MSFQIKFGKGTLGFEAFVLNKKAALEYSKTALIN